MALCLADNLDKGLDYVFKKKIWLAVYAQDYSGIRFVAKQRKSKKHISLLFDGRHLKRNVTEDFVKPLIFYFFLGANFEVLKAKANSRGIPVNHRLPNNLPKLHLYELLELDLSDRLFHTNPDSGGPAQILLADPWDFESTAAWLEQANLSINIVIHYCFRLLPSVVRSRWFLKKNSSSLEWTTIEAFTGENNQLRFRHATNAKVGRPTIGLRQIPEETEDFAQKVTPEQAARKNNRSSSVSVNLNGITQAVRLGLLDSKAAAKMIQQLSKAVGAVWLHTDTAHKVRYIGYEDGLGFFQCFKISPHLAVFDEQRDQDPYFVLKSSEDNLQIGNFERKEATALNDWKAFFDVVFERRLELLKHKSKILEPLIKKFETATGDSPRQCPSTVSKCIASLKASLKKTKLIICFRDDAFLHALKLWFAHYLSHKVGKGFRGLHIRSSGDNEIGSLVSSFLDIDNIGKFLGIETANRTQYRDEGEDILSVCRDWLPASRCHKRNLPFKPLIDEHNISLENQRIVYSPGKIAGYEKGYRTCLRKRSKVLTSCVLAIYREFSRFLFDTYGYDFTSHVQHQTVPSVAFRCIWLAFYKTGGPLSHSIEKTKPHYEEALRNFCHGGFSYSCQGRVNSGDVLCKKNPIERASSIAEFDLTSCYGFSMTRMSVPGAFCIGYTSENGLLARTDRIQRTNSFEYKSCMMLLHMIAKAGLEITSVYSNFSPLGLFYVKKCPADLVVVAGNGVTYVVQFDGRFAHGCPECRLAGTVLSRYANDCAEVALIEKTNLRDEIFQSWLEVENSKGGPEYQYSVIRDCHTPNYTVPQLEKIFRETPELNKLREPYATLPSHSIKVSEILTAHKDLAYLLVGSGQVPIELRRSTPTRNGTMLVWKRDKEGNNYQDFGWETPEGGSLFTRDTLEYLIREHGFRLESVSSCYFYRRCEVMPRVFRELVEERQRCGSNQKSKAKFIKSIVNFGTGMLGYNPHNKTRMSVPRIVSKMKANCNVDARLFHVGQVRDEMFSIVQTVQRKRKIPATERQSCNVALPLYISVVEYGKHRLLECLTFLFAHCRPGAVKLCYSQVDCAILALSGSTLEEALDPALQGKFAEQKPNFFTTQGEPGLLKEEWFVQAKDLPGGWKFASPYICCYALISADRQGNSEDSSLPPPMKKFKMDFEGYAKASSFNSLTTKTHYDLACNALDRVSTVVEQERRTNKLLNTATEMVSIRLPFTTQR